jgi:hypothetical protein
MAHMRKWFLLATTSVILAFQVFPGGVFPGLRADDELRDSIGRISDEKAILYIRDDQIAIYKLLSLMVKHRKDDEKFIMCCKAAVRYVQDTSALSQMLYERVNKRDAPEIKTQSSDVVKACSMKSYHKPRRMSFCLDFHRSTQVPTSRGLCHKNPASSK